MARHFVLKMQAEIAELSGFSVVSNSISADGECLTLYVESSASDEVTETFQSGIGVFPRTHMAEARRFRLVKHAGNTRKAIDLPKLNVTFPFVDVFPDGRVLIAGSRSQWRSSDDFDRNGIICDTAAGTQHSVLLGDGIEGVAVDSQGRIWVSYFDEGVFGNFGWGNPGPEPIGASGLNCFSEDGNLIWSFPLESKRPISDCYAMNVSGNKCDIYAYSDFDVCRINEEFETEFFETSVEGCHHFAISGDNIVFTGQYDDEPAVGYVGRLVDNKVRGLERVDFVLSDDREVGNGQFFGRGDKIYYFDDSAWYANGSDQWT